tara:strand:- start:411 stop:698 length:288 start_codon:yes stop_codon:yes gene_type:complete
MKKDTHNGWTNYATWRINLEIFDDVEIFEDYFYRDIDAEVCQDYAEELIFSSAPDGLAKDYAYAFLTEVNWYEIAENINETINETNEYKKKQDEV